MIEFIPYFLIIASGVLFGYFYGRFVERYQWNELIRKGQLPKPVKPITNGE